MFATCIPKDRKGRPVKLFVIGATGRSGSWILKEAIERGHKVTALVRPPVDRLGDHSMRFTVVPGELLRMENLSQVIEGHDAIVSALSSDVVEVLTPRMIAAAESAGVTRFIAIAGGGILQLDEHSLRRDRVDYPAVFRKSSAGHLAAWKALETSNLNWSLICTPDLANASVTGKILFREDYMPAGRNSVALGDVARFVLDAAENGLHLRKRIGLTSP